MFLLDTMVLSEAGKRRSNAAVVQWMDDHDADGLYVSTITFGEIFDGIERKRKLDPVFATRLDRWAADTRYEYRERTFPVTTEIALRWGALSAALGRRDLDLFIAATALEHDLTVVTRNVRHFEPTGAKLFNPYEA
ncbi:MAG: type II toxin-antitoxin system VapC family toxin [Methylobacterium mesophilicum]|nr:type II toxin-antitoxin system VapC family toxin [Methylobacterium mesophilicum]